MTKKRRSSTLKYFVLVLETNLVLSRKRGIRQPRRGNRRRMYSRSPHGRYLQTSEPKTGNIFEGQTQQSSEAPASGLPVLQMAEEAEEEDRYNYLSTRSKGSKGGGKKAAGSRGSAPSHSSRSSTSSSPKKDAYIPTIMPTQQATLDVPRRSYNLCKTNNQGGFGSQGRGDQTIVTYVYNVEVEDANMTISNFQREVLPAIEVATLDLMIPELFESLCGSFRRLQLGLLPITEPRYLGMSIYPRDYVTRDAVCGLNFIEPCYVVSGAMTAYTEGISVDVVQEEVMSLVKEVLDFGNLATIVPGVDGIEYRSLTTPSSSQTGILGVEKRDWLLPIAPAEGITSQTVQPPTEPPVTVPSVPTYVPVLALSPVAEITPMMPEELDPLQPVEPVNFPDAQPSDRPAEAPVVMNQNPAEEATKTAASGDSEEDSGGILAWWRWFLAAITLVVMLVAVYFVYRSGAKQEHSPVETRDSVNEMDGDSYPFN